MPILAPALLTMVAAQLLDLGTFLTMVHRVGFGGEANPLAANILEGGAGGLVLLVLAKLALIVLVGSVTVSLVALRRRSFQRAGWVLLGFAIAAGILGGWSNALTFGAI